VRALLARRCADCVGGTPWLFDEPFGASAPGPASLMHSGPVSSSELELALRDLLQ